MVQNSTKNNMNKIQDIKIQIYILCTYTTYTSQSDFNTREMPPSYTHITLLSTELSKKILCRLLHRHGDESIIIIIIIV